jgi:virginiamycin B lyase
MWRRIIGGILVSVTTWGIPATQTHAGTTPSQDVWVHYDYMVGPGYSDAPSAAAMQLVVNAFKAHGVTLHIDPQHTPIPAYKAVVPDWPSPYPVSDAPTCTGPDAVRFSDLKRRYFHPSSNHPWHYAIYVDEVFSSSVTDIVTCPSSYETGGHPPFFNMTGYSQVGFLDVPGGLGSNFVLAMEPWRDLRLKPTDVNEAAIFMHELGHNLGLCHGGPDLDGCNPAGSGANYKPNYISVMNYDFEFGIPYAATPGSTTIAGFRADYSDVKLPDLNESCLDEAAGIGDTAHPTDLTVKYGRTRIYPVVGPADWNEDGNTTDTCLKIDLNGDGVRVVDHGANDWLWIRNRLAPPAITNVSVAGTSLTVDGMNLTGPATVIFTGGASALGFDYHLDEQSPATSFSASVPVGARSGPITVITAAGAFTSAQGVTITAHAIGSGDIAAGPGNTMWFTEPDGNGIGRVNADGTVTQFPISNPVPMTASDPYGIVPGPDGDMWFTELTGNRIGRITPSGTVTTFPVPTPGSRPFGITAGPDGNIWFTEEASGKIGRITPSGTITEFLGQLYGLTGTSSTPEFHTLALHGITSADGSLWFTFSPDRAYTQFGFCGAAGETEYEDFGSMDPRATDSFTLYASLYPVLGITASKGITPSLDPLFFSDSVGIMETDDFSLAGVPCFPDAEGERPTTWPSSSYFGISVDPHSPDSIWLTESAGGRIAYNPGLASFAEFPVSGLVPDEAIAADQDGNGWFVEIAAGKVARITPAGTITEFAIP